MPSIINASSSGSGGLISTGDASGVLQLQRNGTVSVGIDTNGFLLLPGTSGATTNSSTGTFNSGLQLGDNLQILNYSLGSNTQCQFMSNAYYNGGYKYINSSAGSSKMYVGAAGVWEFAGAAVGTAGNPITYTATLGCNGLGYTVYLQGGGATESGTGITFPASQSASTNPNTLDDYEEGTFTATVNSNNGSFNVPGWYVKVGAMVSVGISISYNGTAGTSNLNSITGLPFTNSSSLSIPAPCGLYYIMTTSTGDNNTCVPGFIVGGTSNAITLYTTQVGTTEGRPRFINSNSYFQVCATYPAS